MFVMTRRIVWVMLIAIVGGAAFAWIRDRRGPQIGAPPEWPPLEPDAETPPASTGHASDDSADATEVAEVADAPDAADDVDASDDVSDDGAEESDTGTPAWCEANDDGSCPDTHQIKVNTTSRIFHVPGGRFYDRTTPHRCYATAEAALADGYRQSKS